jgi:hypothetical protein
MTGELKTGWLAGVLNVCSNDCHRVTAWWLFDDVDVIDQIYCVCVCVCVCVRGICAFSSLQREWPCSNKCV